MKLHILSFALALLQGVKATEHCWPCSDDVCFSELNACPETNPFVCLEGKAKSGCTADENIWLNPIDCVSCCDLSNCPTRTVEEPAAGATSGGKGKGKGKGMSSSHRRRRIANVDTNNRERRATEHCWPCSDDVCFSEMNACPETNPFVCLEGKAKSGCTADENIWLNPIDCVSCCDLSNCPTRTVEEPAAGATSGGKGKGKGKGMSSSRRRRL